MTDDAMYVLYTQDEDSDVEMLATSSSRDKLEDFAEAEWNSWDMEYAWPGFSRYGARSDTLYAEAGDTDWWIDRVEVL